MLFFNRNKGRFILRILCSLVMNRQVLVLIPVPELGADMDKMHWKYAKGWFTKM